MTDKKKMIPKEPESQWLHSYMQPSLVEAKAYALDIIQDVRIKLDQNECPWDFPNHLKDKILNRVRERSWNRYPNPLADELTEALAAYLNVPAECILTGPGSNHLLTLVLETFGHCRKGKMVVLRPSFQLFEAHCRYSGISYEPWELDENLQFDLKKLPSLPDGSVVLFASPNNPTGTHLSRADFETLLRENPRTMFIADEAYTEFAGESYADLMQSYSNMIIVRTLSKTMGAAGIRLGYVLGSASAIREIKKLRLPYLLNHFTVDAVMTMLQDPEIQEFINRNVSNARSERERIYQAVRPLAEKNGFVIKNSKANFLLMRWPTQEAAMAAYKKLIAAGILVRDVSKGPKLDGCLRVSVGTAEQNDLFIAAMA